MGFIAMVIFVTKL